MITFLVVLGAVAAAAGYGVIFRSRTDRRAAAGAGLWCAGFALVTAAAVHAGAWWLAGLMALFAAGCCAAAVRLIVRDYCCPGCLDARSSGRRGRG